MSAAVPRIMEALFECTLQMIIGNFEDYPEIRIQFFTLLQVGPCGWVCVCVCGVGLKSDVWMGSTIPSIGRALLVVSPIPLLWMGNTHRREQCLARGPTSVNV